MKNKFLKTKDNSMTKILCHYLKKSEFGRNIFQ